VTSVKSTPVAPVAEPRRVTPGLDNDDATAEPQPGGRCPESVWTSTRITALLVAAGIAVAGCTAGSPTSTAATRPAPGSARPLATACPTTLPGTAVPPGSSPTLFFGAQSSYGNGRLWVGGLWPAGVIKAGPDFIAEDGSIGMKFGWWRAVPGNLRITGRRLDATAAPLRSDVPTGYGERGFQASGVNFPSPGCWEITGTMATTTLTFVTRVIKDGGQ
jgi:hypothetical protein